MAGCGHGCVMAVAYAPLFSRRCVRRSGTESLQTLRWRELDSNWRFRAGGVRFCPVRNQRFESGSLRGESVNFQSLTIMRSTRATLALEGDKDAIGDRIGGRRGPDRAG